MKEIRVLLVDDTRTAEQVGYPAAVIARSFDAGVEQLQTGSWDLLLLDHDLADYAGGIERTGADIITWLAEPSHRQFIPSKIECVSSNPIGRRRIEDASAKLRTDPDELLTQVWFREQDSQ